MHISIDAKIKAAISDVANVLDGIGRVTFVGNGQKLKCVVLGNDGSKQTLSLTSDEIVFSSYSILLDLKTRATNIIKFLSLIGILSEFYDISAYSFYKQIMEILKDITKHMYASSKIEANQERLAEINESLSKSNETLSRNMIGILNSRNELEKSLECFKHFSFAILNSLSKNGHDIEKVLKGEFEVSEETANVIVNSWSAENEIDI